MWFGQVDILSNLLDPGDKIALPQRIYTEDFRRERVLPCEEPSQLHDAGDPEQLLDICLMVNISCPTIAFC
jgi:hypothetical protein